MTTPTSLTRTAKSSTSTRKKKVPATESNYMLIELDWREEVVLPYEDGLAFLKALQHAESLKDGKITPYRHNIRSTILSNADYQRHKMAHLLGCSIDDLPEDFNSEAA